MARKSTRRSTVKFGSFLRSSHFAGKSLVSVSGKKYRVKGVKVSFGSFHRAKAAANRLAYAGKARKSTARKGRKSKSGRKSRR